MSEHLSPALLSGLADGELTPAQRAVADAHLAECPACMSSALYQSLLKSATARAGQRYSVSRQFEERLARSAQHEETQSKSSSTHASQQAAKTFAFAGWAAAIALLLISGSIFLVERNSNRTDFVSSQTAALTTEVCDQHVATLAANLPPQVLSSDRHTVKPWFQGKLPFSFNLPENLPDDTKLEGANLTYLHNQPTALLLYSVGKHRVSVFVSQKTNAQVPDGFSAEHSGFHVTGFSTGDLEVVAVSDVDPARLSSLVALIMQSQNGA
jgi:anti-sigma factor RsiW